MAHITDNMGYKERGCRADRMGWAIPRGSKSREGESPSRGVGVEIVANAVNLERRPLVGEGYIYSPATVLAKHCFQSLDHEFLQYIVRFPLASMYPEAVLVFEFPFGCYSITPLQWDE